jgi:hypothetical protein
VRCGVSGTAEGGGLFRQVEVSRQMQMEPAKEGPSLGEE